MKHTRISARDTNLPPPPWSTTDCERLSHREHKTRQRAEESFHRFEFMKRRFDASIQNETGISHNGHKGYNVAMITVSEPLWTSCEIAAGTAATTGASLITRHLFRHRHPFAAL